MSDNKKIKILIVEDDYLVTDMIKRTLAELDYNNVEDVSNGKEAIERACYMKPDIIFMDIEMPEINGIDATQKIQEKCPTPVIILTAFETDRLINEASAAGVSAYLVKPLKKDLIERTIIIAISRHKDLMQLRKLNNELRFKNKEISKASSEIKILKGILPICSSCKKVRDDDGYWTEVAEYISKNSEAGFSHGVCPHCMDELYGNEEWYLKLKGKNKPSI